MSAASRAEQVIDGRYRLIRRLGTGGSASVHLAEDLRLHREVAVKLFHADAADAARQSAEITLMATLAHPALVRLYDGGQTVDPDGSEFTFLVMEFVDGPTLRSALAQGPMSPVVVAAIGTDLASALAYVHERGVVHRDVKPANVLMPPGDDGITAKLSDFGIARLLDDTRMTGTGLTLGTVAYMSPEQVMGRTAGPASDIFSLGLVLIEALTGTTVYEGGGAPAALARLHRPATVPDAFGSPWASLLRAMVQPDPALRPSAAQVRRQLAPLTGLPSDVPTAAVAVPAVADTVTLPATMPATMPVTPVPPSPVPTGPDREKRRRRVLIAAALVAVVALVGVGVPVLRAALGGSPASTPPAPQATHSSVPVPSGLSTDGAVLTSKAPTVATSSPTTAVTTPSPPASTTPSRTASTVASPAPRTTATSSPHTSSTSTPVRASHTATTSRHEQSRPSAHRPVGPTAAQHPTHPSAPAHPSAPTGPAGNHRP